MHAVYERERERAAIDAALAGAAAGEGAIVLVTGHAGAGKTRLLAAARERAPGPVLSATGTSLERGHAFGVTRQLLVPAIGARPDLLDGAAAAARPLFLGADAGMPAGSEERMFDLLHALHWAIADLADPRSLLIVVDDAHWADRPSLRLLLYLAQRIRELPVALAVAARPDEPGAHEDLLRHLRDHPATVTLQPPPLTLTGVGSVIRERFPTTGAGFVAAARSVTGGNPFLLRELLADLAARGALPDDALAARLLERPPETIRRGAIARLERLAPAAGAFARAVAVLGEAATLPRCAALSGLAPEEAMVHADRLAAVELLRDGDPPAFAHPLVGAAVEAAAAPAERARLHGAAAELLDQAGAQAETIAAHLLRSACAGRLRTVELLRRAAASALARGSPAAAVAYLRRALEEPAVIAVQPALLEELAQAEALDGHADASEHVVQALSLVHEPVRRAELLERLGAILQQRGDMAAAADAFACARDTLPERSEHTPSRTRLEAAWLTAALGSPAHAAQAQRRVAPMLARAGAALTGPERSLALLRSMQLVFAGEQCDQAVALALRAWNAGELLADGDGDLAAVWQVAGTLAWADALDEAERVADTGMLAAERTGSAVARALACYSRSWPRYWRGDIAGAAADAQAAVDAWSGEFTMYLPVAAYWAAIAQLELGAIDLAEALVALPEHDPRWAQTTLVGPLLAGRGLVALARGAPTEAVALLERAGAVALASLVTNPAVLPWRSYLALAFAAAGQRDRARDLALEEVRLARHFGAARPLGFALRAAGLAHRGADAVALLDEAVMTLRRSPAQLELTRALVDQGAALRRAGRRAAARDPLREGLALAQRFGATVLEQRATEELQATGARPRRRALTGAASLTPSELRVAQLAAGGATNREIAQTLFVTVKAVRFHLAHIYRKLDLAGREQLADALRQPYDAHSPTG